MFQSRYIRKAKSLIERAKKKTYSVEERRESAIRLSALMLSESRRIQSNSDRKMQHEMSKMLRDPKGKAFILQMTDQCFRSTISKRISNQLIFLLKKFGIPRYLSMSQKIKLLLFRNLGSLIPGFSVPIAKREIRKKTEKVIIPGEKGKLKEHVLKRHQEGVRINLNHLGEAILGEEEADKRLKTYLEDLAKPEIEYISVKISTISSQLNLIAWENTLTRLEKRLKTLYRNAMNATFTRPDGKTVPKFVNLDMEEYRDLHLTVELFQRVLDDPEFHSCMAGIVFQSYLPDSYLLQQELTVWAMKRVARGGSPIKIRLVKGANLATEQVEASLRGWSQAPYTTKEEVDANYKRMMTYALQSEHAQAVHIGIASHNLFDIAYAILLRAEKQVEPYVEFEMLEGMADPIRRVVQSLTGGILLYCPTASQEEFPNAISYLVRRLDENTAPQNFLRYSFNLIPGTREWQNQSNQFSRSCHSQMEVNKSPNRTQNRLIDSKTNVEDAPFENEADTDFSLPQNRKWAEEIISTYKDKTFDKIPLVIGENEIFSDSSCLSGFDPSVPGKELYRYAIANQEDIEKAIQTAILAEKDWALTPVSDRARLAYEATKILRQSRGHLIGVMIADGAKTVAEADVEISEAIDFVEYYRRNIKELEKWEDIRWNPKGTVLVTPPWNFPCSIPLGCVIASLLAGNCVIFKPAPETPLVGWVIANILWEAGFSKRVLQYINCQDEPIGSLLVKDNRIKSIILTGATQTAKLMQKLNPGLDLIAESGGKNTLIITSLADRDLAIKDLVQSAFGHSGQKCSACSLALLEADVYEDLHFRKLLKDAAASLSVGSAWDLDTRINPLIHNPNPTLLRGLTQLEEKEHWLLEPKQDPNNPNLWTPGIKLGVQPGSFTHQTEFFGPVLGLMRTENLKQAIQFANDTPYGLTAGIHTLDDREKQQWKEEIEVGNGYINRGITGAIIQRQPFGGCKESSFGPGGKAGGNHFMMQLLRPEPIDFPKQRCEPNKKTASLTDFVKKNWEADTEKQLLWKTSIECYSHAWNTMYSLEYDPVKLIGQDNLLSYKPHKKMALRIQNENELFDALRIIAACITCNTLIEISSDLFHEILSKLPHNLTFIKENDDHFIQRIKSGNIRRLRLLTQPSDVLQQAIAEASCNLHLGPVFANGKIELKNYLREVSISHDYHRYGNLGLREGEQRKQLIPPEKSSSQSNNRV